MTASPTRLGRYSLVRSLAQGGMAEIYLARQDGPHGFSKTVVIKRVLPHLAKEPEFARMFLDEARLAAQLNHPNIVAVTDFGEADGTFFIAMEHLVGADLGLLLRALQKRGTRMPAPIVAYIGSAAADALEYAHTLGSPEGTPLKVVHRDISPSNLFLTVQGAVKVLDFGIARAEGKLTQTRTGTLKGKVAYMSPEQARGKPLDARSDVFALGSVLHELLTGEKLFLRDNDYASLAAVQEDPILSPREVREDVPPALSDAIMRALDRDLSMRWPSARQLRVALDSYLAACTTSPAASQLQAFIRETLGDEQIEHILGAARASSAPVDQTLISSSTEVAAPTHDPERDVGTQVLPADEDSASDPATSLPFSRRQAKTARPPAAVRPHAPARDSSRATVLAVVAVAAIAIVAFLFLREPANAPAKPTTAIADVAPVKKGPELRVEFAAPLVPDSVVVAVAQQPPSIVDAGSSVENTEQIAKAPVEVSRPIKVAEKRQPVKRLEVKPAAAVAVTGTGTIDVNCVPWCRIYVDGADTGRNSPAFGLKVSAGKHTLRLVNPPSGMERMRSVEITAGASIKEIVKF